MRIRIPEIRRLERFYFVAVNFKCSVPGRHPSPSHYLQCYFLPRRDDPSVRQKFKKSSSMSFDNKGLPKKNNFKISGSAENRKINIKLNDWCVIAIIEKQQCFCSISPAVKIIFLSKTNLFFHKDAVLLELMQNHGALAQLARAPHWQCGGQGFKSLMLHHFFALKSKI